MARMVPFEPSMRAPVIGLWNSCIGTQYPLTDRLFHQNVLGDPFGQSEGNVVALENGRIVGWVLCRALRQVSPLLTRYEGRASIGALCVHPHHRRRGIGASLFAHAETFAIKMGATVLSVVHYPYHLLPGVPSEAPDLKAFLAKQGFGDWRETYDLRQQLTDPALSRQLTSAMDASPKGVVMRPAQRGEDGAIVDFVGREFPGGWPYDTVRFFEKGGAPSDLVLVLENRTIIGFAHTHTRNSVELRGSTHWFPLLGERWGGLGPMGIAAPYRGRGLGYALLCASVRHLRDRGVEDLVIDWTELVGFYGRLGFRIWKRYWQGAKQLQVAA